MRHENSVFHQLTKHIPWSVFDAAVARHGSDRRVRRLRTRDQFLALLYGQLSGASSLRGIEDGLASQAARLYHAGLRGVSRSTLSDANAKRSFEVYADVFDAMARLARPGLRRKLRPAVRLLDATKVSLSGLSADWARFSADHCAAKLHVVYDPHGGVPLRAVVTPDRVNDITPAKAMPIEPGATYVFDLAYYSYHWWAALDARGCRFVTRLKKNAPVTVVETRPAAPGGAVLADRVGHLSRRLAASRANPFDKPVRVLTVAIDSGRTIDLVTNDLDAPADDIAALYKQRWQIELFFKWIKQNLKIKHFLGTSENAVKIQIFVALIAFLVLRAAHRAQTAIPRPQAFARLVRLNIMHRRSILNLKDPPKTPPNDARQMNFQLSHC